MGTAAPDKYSAAKWTRARVEVRNVVAPAPQVDSVSCSQTQHVLLIVCSMTQVSAKLEHSIQFCAEVYKLGTVKQGSFFDADGMLALRKATDTVLVVLSFCFHLWK